MGAFQFQVTYDPFDVASTGIGFSYHNDILLSGLSILTRGLVYGKADIWINADDCLATSWTEVNEL